MFEILKKTVSCAAGHLFCSQHRYVRFGNDINVMNELVCSAGAFHAGLHG